MRTFIYIVSLFFTTISFLNAAENLPYLTKFETQQWHVLGNLDGQVQWSVDQGSADVVSDGNSFRGSNSVTLNAGSPFTQVSIDFNNPGSYSLFFLKVAVKPYASSLAAKDEFLDMGGSIVGFFDVGSSTGEYYVKDGQSGTWVATGFTQALDGSGVAQNWHRIGMRQDFAAAKEWDFYVGKETAAAGLTYVDTSLTQPTTFVMMGHANGDVRFDIFYISVFNPIFRDADGDGMSDVFEAANGSDANASDRNADSSGDGNSNLALFVASFTGDTDLDNWTDVDELATFGDLSQDPDDDFDGDGLTNKWEYDNGYNASSSDEDVDSMDDGWEITYFGDLSRNGSGDYDNDGITDKKEHSLGLDPSVSDEDSDGMLDGDEIDSFGDLTQAYGGDYDNDGLPNGWELDNGLKPNKSTGQNGPSGDPDKDDFGNILEYVGGSNPQDAASYPGNP